MGQGETIASSVGTDLVAALELVPAGIWLHSAEGERLQLNGVARELYERLGGGGGPDDLSHLTDADGRTLGVSDMPGEITKATGEPITGFEIVHTTSDGTKSWLSVSTRALPGDGPPYAVVASMQDITELRVALAEMRQASSQFAQSFLHAPIGMAIVGLDGSFKQVNASLCGLLGYEEHELLSLTFQAITHPEDLTADLGLLAELLEGERTSYQMHKRYIRGDRKEIWASLSVALVSDEAGKPLHFISQVHDLTDRRRYEQRLKQLADRDHLTGLLNRRRFEEELQRQVSQGRRSAEPAALMLIDVDHFKQVNDTHGHAAGDDVLRVVARVLDARLRGADVTARVGGDEFAVILASTDREGALTVAHQICESMRAECDADVTMSIGVTMICAGKEIDEILACADRALYLVKESGRDGVMIAAEDTPEAEGATGSRVS